MVNNDDVKSMEEEINDIETTEEVTEEETFEFSEAEVFVTETTDEEQGFLPEATDDAFTSSDSDIINIEKELQGTELDNFEAAEIEEVEFIEDERLESIIESILFASDRPVSLNSIKMVFEGTNIRSDRIRKTINQLAIEYAGSRRGVTLEEVPGGYQLRTKIDNLEFLRRGLKARAFKLSGPALEVLAIVAYKQPVIKSEIDEIRGVESGHMLRALMEKGLVMFDGKSELPGKPMQYATTKKFLEIFGLRNLKELPTLSQIDELIPEGIGDVADEKKQKLSDITDSLSEGVAAGSYSDGEEELLKISGQLEQIDTSSEFFEKEKQRQKEKRDQDKAQNIREALALGEEVSNRDANWLKRYDEALMAGIAPQMEVAEEVSPELAVTEDNNNMEVEAVEASDQDDEDAEIEDFKFADNSYDDQEAADLENEDQA